MGFHICLSLAVILWRIYFYKESNHWCVGFALSPLYMGDLWLTKIGLCRWVAESRFSVKLWFIPNQAEQYLNMIYL